jgi:phosphoserine phosphatase
MIELHGHGSPTFDSNAAPVAVFDFDNTCVFGDVTEAVLRVLDAGLVATYTEVEARHGRSRAFAWCGEAVAGRPLEDLERLARRGVELAVAEGRMAPREEIASLITAMTDAGWQCWVVSASEQVITRIAAATLGFAPNRVLGMTMRRHGDLILPEVVGPLPMLGGKVDVIDARIGRRPTFAAGDNDTDVAMMAAARYALVIDRGHPVVQAAAREHGWWVQTGWPISRFV